MATSNLSSLLGQPLGSGLGMQNQFYQRNPQQYWITTTTTAATGQSSLVTTHFDDEDKPERKSTEKYSSIRQKLQADIDKWLKGVELPLVA